VSQCVRVISVVRRGVRYRDELRFAMTLFHGLRDWMAALPAGAIRIALRGGVPGESASRVTLAACVLGCFMLQGLYLEARTPLRLLSTVGLGQNLPGLYSA